MEFYKLFNNITFTESCKRYTTNYKILKISFSELQEIMMVG